MEFLPIEGAELAATTAASRLTPRTIYEFKIGWATWAELSDQLGPWLAMWPPVQMPDGSMVKIVEAVHRDGSGEVEITAWEHVDYE